MYNPMFRSKFSEEIFEQRYTHPGCETWADLAQVLVNDVCANLLTKTECEYLIECIRDLKFVPGGRYLHYAGRQKRFYSNCFALKAMEDTREDWASLAWRAEMCLMTGGGIGVDYSVYRPSGKSLAGTGGRASGPIPAMKIINEIGRNVELGGSRRSAMYASLHWKHEDIHAFMKAKNWDQIVPGTDRTLANIKSVDFTWPAPLDMTNISVNYDTEWLADRDNEVFKANVVQTLSTGEPGFSFNFHDKEQETLRNACTELTSADDNDVCNLGSINLSRIDSIYELADVVRAATKFLVCGTVRAEVPYPKIAEVRNKNRRLGLGLMGIHEWLLKRSMPYQVTDELHRWLSMYKTISYVAASQCCDRLSLSRSIAVRAIAPTGKIALLAGTTTGIEPLYAVAYKQRYYRSGWHYQYIIDSVAQSMVEQYGLKPDEIETAHSINYKRRIQFQADVQDYIDQAIASTINLPPWRSKNNNPDTVQEFTKTLAAYAPRLRGLTCYPDGARGGQPLTVVSYEKAKKHVGVEYAEHDICNLTHRGSCG